MEKPINELRTESLSRYYQEGQVEEHVLEEPEAGIKDQELGGARPGDLKEEEPIARNPAGTERVEEKYLDPSLPSLSSSLPVPALDHAASSQLTQSLGNSPCHPRVGWRDEGHGGPGQTQEDCTTSWLWKVHPVRLQAHTLFPALLSPLP